MSDMSRWPRKLIIAIGVSWWSAVLGLVFLAYFLTRPCTDGVCDGLGRHLTLAPDFIRLFLHTDRLWVGWRWTAIDMAVIWVSAIVGYILLGFITDDSKPSISKLLSVYEPPPTTFIKRAVLGTELQEMQGAIAEAAALATSRSDITLEPEEEGWSIRLNGAVALQVDSSATGQKALAYARSLIDRRKSMQSTDSPL